MNHTEVRQLWVRSMVGVVLGDGVKVGRQEAVHIAREAFLRQALVRQALSQALVHDQRAEAQRTRVEQCQGEANFREAIRVQALCRTGTYHGICVPETSY